MNIKNIKTTYTDDALTLVKVNCEGTIISLDDLKPIDLEAILADVDQEELNKDTVISIGIKIKCEIENKRQMKLERDDAKL